MEQHSDLTDEIPEWGEKQDAIPQQQGSSSRVELFCFL